MQTNLLVQLVSKIALQEIDGIPYCVWGYRISWSIPTPELKERIGLVFSSRLNIKDPASYPGVQSIQGTRVIKAAGDDKQYVFQDIDQPKISIVDLFFLAPCAEDSFTPVLLGTETPESGNWQFLPFQTDVGKPSSQTQTIRGPAIVCPSKTQSTQVQQLTSSSRRLQKATLVSLQLDSLSHDAGGAIQKLGFLNQLRLQPGEVEAARSRLLKSDGSIKKSLKDTNHESIKIDKGLTEALKSLEWSDIPSQLSSPSIFANVPTSTLQAFGKQIVGLRQEMVNNIKQQHVSAVKRSELIQKNEHLDRLQALSLFNAALVATKSFEEVVKATPIGYLNLERIEMTPVGIERGELIATIPLAPLEKTAVVHKEWSVTSKEFTSIVTDSLEDYSETGVTDNTELAQSTTSQTSHNNQFNVNGTVTANYVDIVTSTVASAFTAQDQQSDSANQSRKHAISLTRKASTRVKKEHKVTISTTTVTGTSETSTRILENSSSTDPIRIDYFSMMRKWHVGLYRYGLRLTYDIAVPEPGAMMRKIYADIEALKNQIGPFDFLESHTSINEKNYLQLADQYDAQAPLLPQSEYTFTISPQINVCPGGACGVLFTPVSIEIKDGYAIESITLDGGVWGYKGVGAGYGVVGTSFFKWDAQSDGIFPTTVLLDGAGNHFLGGAEGRQSISIFMNDVRSASVQLKIKVKLTEQALKQWQQDVWNALYNAAQTQYYAKQQEIQARIAELEDKITGVDTLTLRREENEEIMKCVLRWLLGPAFEFMPPEVVFLFAASGANLQHGIAFTGNETSISLPMLGSGKMPAEMWQNMFRYQEMVKFINEAIEWENVLYFLYSYFWDVPPSWDFIRQLRHPDSTRQAFLRAGTARVVLTVRPGWEKAWVNFVEMGVFGQALDPKTKHPYMSIAEEIHNYAQTNYPGIPPANPGGGPLPDNGAYAASVSSDKLSPSGGNPVKIEVMSSEGFLVGYTAVLDSYEPTVVKNGKKVSAHQETQRIVAVPDATHITVERIENPHDGSTKPFPVMQAGEKGQLIAEWFEYTPTSGTDIAVTSNLATIS